MTIASRRELFRSSYPLLATLFAGRCFAAPSARTRLVLSLEQEFGRSSARAVSPDGARVCLEDWGKSGYPLLVIEVDGWRETYTGSFHCRVSGVDFFADGRALLLGCPPAPHSSSRRELVVELAGGARAGPARSVDFAETVERLQPVGGRSVLCERWTRKSRHLTSLSIVDFSSGRELVRADLEAQRSDSRPPSAVVLSADRRLLLYFLNNEVVCRRSGDLRVVWAQRVEPGLSAGPLAASATGLSFAAVIKSGFRDKDNFINLTPLYIATYSGGTGDEVSRLQLRPKYGIALSPNGKLLAVPVDEPGEMGDLFATVDVYDALSGDMLASLVHDRIPSGRRQFLLSGCTAEFTSDGKYLITSGMRTKVWKVGGESSPIG